MEQVNLYPVCLKLEGQRCLVVGGGKVAQRKVGGLKECGALIFLVSPEITPKLAQAAGRGEFQYFRRGFEACDLEGMRVVIAATDNKALNEQIARMCEERGILVNVADNPALSTFFVPAHFHRGPLCISVSTGGRSPLLARRIREFLQSEIGPEFGDLALLLGTLRERTQTSIPDQFRRQKIFEKILTEDFVRLLKTGNKDLLKEQVEACLSLPLE
ncbi:MAG: bifunctional precorrin-2 dehydrogenase/sirohydrochlorin ferrochelatase [Bacillota bacterium]|nr:bifunctional precorrin-2 dehydrogenase/sirohydrochlorin ferrochelatase [Bacillota bacterium]